MQIKLELIEAGWTLRDIEESDLNELMKLFAFRDAVKEHNDLKYLDEYTLF